MGLLHVCTIAIASCERRRFHQMNDYIPDNFPRKHPASKPTERPSARHNQAQHKTQKQKANPQARKTTHRPEATHRAGRQTHRAESQPTAGIQSPCNELEYRAFVSRWMKITYYSFLSSFFFSLFSKPALVPRRALLSSRPAIISNACFAKAGSRFGSKALPNTSSWAA